MMKTEFLNSATKVVAILIVSLLVEDSHSADYCLVLSLPNSCADIETAYPAALCSGCVTDDPPEVPTSEATFTCTNTDRNVYQTSTPGYSTTRYAEWDSAVEDETGEVHTSEEIEANLFGEDEIQCGVSGECDYYCESETVNGYTTVACVLATEYEVFSGGMEASSTTCIGDGSGGT